VPQVAGIPNSADGPEVSDIRVLFEDADLLAVDKPAGLVAHPTYKHPDGTLADAIFARQEVRGEGRPWLLHRLDRATSGVVLFAKTERARRSLVRQFERRTVRKRYLALVAGTLPRTEGLIEAPLARDPADRRRTIVVEGGQPATTRYRVLATRGDYALALVAPITGRTHQIRAHFAWLGAPIAGDVRYLGEGHPSTAVAPRALLHAWRLGFRHPADGEWMEISAPPPADLEHAIRALGLEQWASAFAAYPIREWEDEP
jgi:23S rRNA pseudouridine1911/1915/1917 synthase